MRKSEAFLRSKGIQLFNENHPAYKSLREILIEERRPIIFWLGAGASFDAGIPGWAQLRNLLADAAMERLRDIEGPEGDEAEAAVELAKVQRNLWGAFSTLKRYAGETTYRDEIRKHIAPKDNTQPPDVLKLIWSMPQVKGVITLNLDGLEEKAHRFERQSEMPDVFTGANIKQHVSTIGSHRPFIARLHGHHSDYSSWVFTEDEISNLLRDPGYRAAIDLVLKGSTVVFLGISAEDVAAGGFCQNLAEKGVHFGSHYWITNKVDSNTSEWAEKYGIQKVIYKVTEGENHSDALLDLLKSLNSGRTEEPEGEPIVISQESLTFLPTPKEMRLLDEDQSRTKLNQFAKHLVEAKGGTNTPEYDAFLNEYSLPIHQSWHISDNPGGDQYFGYKVRRKVAGSAFSSIWEVEDASNQRLALKVIQIENLKKGLQLESFRRGVKSQKLLGDSNHKTGFVKVREAFEIPPSVVMEFVDGANLEELSLQSGFDFWSDGLQVALHICRALIAAHGCQYGVLHRDVRPSNIILPYYYYGEYASDLNASQYDVQLLNYDMSWHKEASGKVIPGNALEAGYYAPEMLRHTQDDISRTAKVDSYGIGMTIFYMISKSAPPIAGSTAPDWPEYLAKLRSNNAKNFPISGRLIRRIIETATNPVVSKRATVHEIEGRLNELITSVRDGLQGACIEHIAELLYGEVGGANYDVSNDGRKFSWEVVSGRSIEIEASRSTSEIRMLFVNKQGGQTDWRNIDKNWSSKLDTAKDIFKSGGWKVLPGTTYASRTISLGCSISLSEVRSNFPKVSETLRRGLDKVRID
ncbi:SIR2 family protein [Sulfitobacter sp. 1A05707]|uniref:SIR2 family protein n=1 Tax=Sulfitobacter sp. 1A05707 TaxID=3368560 RepID=UPI0037477222